MARGAENNDSKLPTSLADIFMTPAETEQTTIVPIGGIVYDEAKKFIALGSDIDGKIVVKRVNNASPLLTSQMVEKSGRLIDLSAFSQVQILQMGLDAVSIHKFSSIRTAPSLGIAFSHEDAETHQKTPYLIEEDEILRLFTGEKGGIVVFSGNNLPEDNALLFEREVGDQKHAILLFIKPQGQDQYIADSVDGVYEILAQLNQEFADHAPLPLQTQALHALDKAIQMGAINFHDSLVRQEIFKTRVIALARLATKTSDRKYPEQLQKDLPQLNEDFGTHVAEFFGSIHDNTPLVDKAIDSIIRRQQIAQVHVTEVKSPLRIPKTEATILSPKDQQVYNSLQMKSSREWWVYLAKERSYRSDNVISRKFVETLIESIYSAKSKVQFDDLHKLIQALFQSEYRNVYVDYYLSMSQQSGKIHWSNSYNDSYKKSAATIEEALTRWLNFFERESLEQS